MTGSVPCYRSFFFLPALLALGALFSWSRRLRRWGLSVGEGAAGPRFEALAVLPKLTTIQLRGAQTRRVDWPESMQELLDLKSSTSAYLGYG